MADGKKSFLLYIDLVHTYDKLTDEEAGKLIKHTLHYVNDRNPVADRVTELLFEPIKQQLKRDLKKWESIIDGKSRAGKASAEKRKQQKPTDSTHVDFVQHTSTDSTVNVDENEDVTVNESEGEKPRNLDFSGDLKTTHANITDDAEFISRSAIHLKTSEAIFKEYCRRKVEGWSIAGKLLTYNISAMRGFIMKDFEEQQKAINNSVGAKVDTGIYKKKWAK